MIGLMGRAFGIQSLRSRVRPDGGLDPRRSAAPIQGAEPSGLSTEHTRTERKAR